LGAGEKQNLIQLARIRFSISISSAALLDIESAKNYYEEKQKGLGIRFGKTIRNSISSLPKQPYFQIRYSDIRCKPIPKFPFMIHFSIDETKNRINIYGVIHTSKNPAQTWIKQ
jgi:hypothetical protein